MASQEVNLLKCAVCLNQYDKPKLLQCGHTFCEGCLLRCYDSSPHEPRRLSCPICREETPVPSNGIVGLRHDFKVEQFKDQIEQIILRKDHKKNNCNGCSSPEKTKGYCKMCNMYYCEDCLSKHNTTPVFKDHIVFGTCEIHNGISRDHYCKSCALVVCSKCVIDEHGVHEVTEAELAYKENMSVITRLQETIDEKRVQQLDVKKTIETSQRQTLQSYEQVEFEIVTRASEMIASIETQKAVHLHKVQKKRDEQLGQMLVQLESATSFLERTQTLQKIVDGANDMDKLATHDSLIQRLRTMAHSDVETFSGKHPLKMKFVAGHKQPILGKLENVKRNNSDTCRENTAETFHQLEYGMAIYMKKHMKEEISMMLEDIPDVTANAESDGRFGIIVRGLENNCQLAIQKLQKLAQDIKSDKLVIKQDMAKFAENVAFRQSLKQLEVEHQVIIVDEDKSNQRVAQGPPPSQERKTSQKTRQTLTTPEGIVVSLQQSTIATQEVGAIVNSTNRTLHLKDGCVSKALYSKGGKTIKEECRRKAPNGIDFGDVLVTAGGKLNCDIVIHGACCKWDKGAGPSEQVLRKIVANCFKEANNKSLTSLAMPPIGVGPLGFDPQFVALIILEEIFTFSRHHPQTTLRDIRIVVYVRDNNIFKAFEEILFGSDVTVANVRRRLLGIRRQEDQVTFRGCIEGQSASERSVTLTVYAQSSAVINRTIRDMHDLCNAAVSKPIQAEVRWSFEEGDQYRYFPDELSTLLEEAYQTNQNTIRWQTDDDNIDSVNFSRMTLAVTSSTITGQDANTTDVRVKRNIGDITLSTSSVGMIDGDYTTIEDLDIDNCIYEELTDRQPKQRDESET